MHALDGVWLGSRNRPGTVPEHLNRYQHVEFREIFIEIGVKNDDFGLKYQIVQIYEKISDIYKILNYVENIFCKWDWCKGLQIL